MVVGTAVGTQRTVQAPSLIRQLYRYGTGFHQPTQLHRTFIPYVIPNIILQTAPKLVVLSHIVTFVSLACPHAQHSSPTHDPHRQKTLNILSKP